MRILLLCLAALLTTGVVNSQDAEPDAAVSLIGLLAKEKAIAFKVSRENRVYELRLISDDVVKRSRDYHTNRSANVAECVKLQKELLKLIAKHRIEIADDPTKEVQQKEVIAGIEERIAKVSRPTGAFRVGEITRHGQDFIGIREFDSTTEFLIPLCRIVHVISSQDDFGITK